MWITGLVVLAAGSLLAQEPPPAKAWTSSAGAGLAITSGNTDTQSVNLSFATAWDPKTGRLFKADALYLRGESNGEKQVDKATALGRYERTVSERLFWFGEVSYLRDPFKAITYLVSPIAGAGYQIVKTPSRVLSLDGGAGATIESSPALGSETSGALKAGESFEWTLSPTSKVTQRLSGLWKTDDFDDALYHFDAGVAAAVTMRAELKLSYTYDYKNQPAVAGVEKGDSALFAAILFKF
jgi:putative salt-induced outer membrane protein